MKKDNRGFSLVELLVVVAILSVCTAIAAISIGSVSSSRAQKCAREMDAFISQGKISAISRSGPVSILFYTSGGEVRGAYYEGDELISDELMARGTFGVSYAMTGGSSVELASAPLRLSFNRDTGAFLDLDSTPGSLTGYGAGVFCEGITVSGGGRSFVIELTPSTGSHRML